METKVNRWTSRLKSAKKQQATETAFMKRTERVEPADMVRVDKGETIKKANAIHDQKQGGATPTVPDFCIVRSYLQYAILTQNTCWTGVLVSFDKAVYDSMVFHPESHKSVFQCQDTKL